MPNHCRNRVEIYGEPDQIKEVKETLAGKKTCFDFNNIVPMPKELEGSDANAGYPNEKDSFEAKRLRKQHGHDNWYDWCCENWDTKWNSYEASLEEEGEENLRYEFLTAWAPPQNVIIELREKFPKLSITAFYDEPGMEAAGYY
jgi:hypothetical protein